MPSTGMAKEIGWISITRMHHFHVSESRDIRVWRRKEAKEREK